MIADSARQRAIIKDSKYAKKLLVVPYTKARRCISNAFTAEGIDEGFLRQTASEIKAEKSGSDWRRSDNERSADALTNLASMTPGLQWQNAAQIHKSSSGWGYLTMSGVKVSVQPELVFSFPHRNITKVGAILVNTTMGEGKSLERSNSGRSVGDYLSSLLFQMLIQRLKEIGPPLNTKCFALDLFRKQVYTAPGAYKSLNRQMEAACEFIAARWPTI